MGNKCIGARQLRALVRPVRVRIEISPVQSQDSRRTFAAVGGLGYRSECIRIPDINCTKPPVPARCRPGRANLSISFFLHGVSVEHLSLSLSLSLSFSLSLVLSLSLSLSLVLSLIFSLSFSFSLQKYLRCTAVPRHHRDTQGPRARLDRFIDKTGLATVNFFFTRSLITIPRQQPSKPFRIYLI